MTIISDQTNFNITQVDNLICDALNDVSLRDVHPAIQNLVCIPRAGTSLSGTSNENGNFSPIQPVSQTIGTTEVIVGAAAAVFVVLGIYLYRRRHVSKDDTKSIDHLDDSDVNMSNMSHSVSYEGGAPFTGTPAMDFTPIHIPTFSAHGGIEAIARQSYFPVSCLSV